MGTELLRAGVALPEQARAGWSAAAIRSHPEVIVAIHQAYAQAGATVHTACTFRTQPGVFPSSGAAGDFRQLTREAVSLARRSVPTGHLVAGSLAPIGDCYDPRGAPAALSVDGHRAMADALAESGADLILCETFPHAGEALIAARAALQTGLPVWLSLTAGPAGALMTTAHVEFAARDAAALGVRAVLLNCIAAAKVEPFLHAAAAGLARARGAGIPRVRLGVYANAGDPGEGLGWDGATDSSGAPARYAQLAQRWVECGATIVGGCCGTGPAHIAALSGLRPNRAPGPGAES